MFGYSTFWLFYGTEERFLGHPIPEYLRGVAQFAVPESPGVLHHVRVSITLFGQVYGWICCWKGGSVVGHVVGHVGHRFILILRVIRDKRGENGNALVSGCVIGNEHILGVPKKCSTVPWKCPTWPKKNLIFGYSTTREPTFEDIFMEHFLGQPILIPRGTIRVPSMDGLLDFWWTIIENFMYFADRWNDNNEWMNPKNKYNKAYWIYTAMTTMQ